MQGYRVIIGGNHIFRFNHPAEVAAKAPERRPVTSTSARGATTSRPQTSARGEIIDWEYAQKVSLVGDFE